LAHKNGGAIQSYMIFTNLVSKQIHFTTKNLQISFLEAERAPSPKDEQHVEEPTTLAQAQKVETHEVATKEQKEPVQEQEDPSHQQPVTESADSSEDDDEDDILAKRTKGPIDGKYL
jgi:hypothetical protein